MRIKSISIYIGHRVDGLLKGPYGMSVHKHSQMMQKAFPKIPIQRVEGREIIQHISQIKKLSSHLWIVPAGESSDLDRVFSDQEISAMKTAVLGGMYLFSTCGSAYWMASERGWNDLCVDNPEARVDIKKQGRVNLFTGLAIGPLSPYPGQTYSTAFFHESVRIQCDQREYHVLLSGGGAFLTEDPSVRVIAEYTQNELKRFGKNSSWKSAAVHFPFGEGQVILSMVHPGYGSEDINLEVYQKAFPDRGDDWAYIHASLSSEEERTFFIQKIFSYFGKRA